MTKPLYPLLNIRLFFNIVTVIMSLLLTQTIASLKQKFTLILENFSLDQKSLYILDRYAQDLLSSNIFTYFSIPFGLAIFKVLFDLKLIQIFGPLISTIEIIFRKVAKFFLLFVLILITFATI